MTQLQLLNVGVTACFRFQNISDNLVFDNTVHPVISRPTVRDNIFNDWVSHAQTCMRIVCIKETCSSDKIDKTQAKAPCHTIATIANATPLPRVTFVKALAVLLHEYVHLHVCCTCYTTQSCCSRTQLQVDVWFATTHTSVACYLSSYTKQLEIALPWDVNSQTVFNIQ